MISFSSSIVYALLAATICLLPLIDLGRFVFFYNMNSLAVGVPERRGATMAVHSMLGYLAV